MKEYLAANFADLRQLIVSILTFIKDLINGDLKVKTWPEGDHTPEEHE